MKKASNKTPQYFGKDLEAMSFAINYHKWIMTEVHSYLGSSAAEVGAGVGNFSKLILDSDIKCLTAFEPSQNMFPLLKKTLDQDKRAKAINGFFGSKNTGESYDSILYINVLEHVEDEAFELATAYDALCRNGHLLIFVPALPWLYSDFDKQVGHYRRYLKKDVVTIVEKVGFSIVKVRYFDLAGIIPWFINFVLFKNSISGGSVSLYDNIVVPPMRFLERLISPPIGKNILLVAKKV